MEVATTRPSGHALRIDWGAISTWLLGFGLVAFLGLAGGGYDPLAHDQVGIAVWWVLLATLLVGALPCRRLGRLSWAALGLLVAFVAWTALSLTWTESVGKTSADLARVAVYLGVFALALFARDSRGGRRMVAAVGAGIALVALVALLSRLRPVWFPEAAQTSRFLPGARERLAYPLDYWNALAALVAIGMPLLLQLATCARTLLFRALAAAALPALALTSFFTLSRGGIAASIVALAVFMALSSDRLPKLLTLLAAGGGGAVLIAAAAQRDALQHGLLNATAQGQGNEMLAMALVVCACVGLLQAGLSIALARGMRPSWAVVSRRQSLIATAAAAVLLLLAVVALGAPARVSHAWSDFKHRGGPGAGTARLGSVAGNGRYQYWRSAVKEASTKPLTGTGSGTFEYWWDRNGDIRGAVRDTHSLYMQTLGELGIVGLVLLAAFLLTTLLAGGSATIRAAGRERPQLAAALAGCVAFCLTAGFDWMWQIPVLPVAFLLLASVLIGTGEREVGRSDRHDSVLRLAPRLSVMAVAVAAIVAIAIPLSTAASLRRSQADARAGDLSAALGAARSAQNAQPGAAAPRLQEALILEAQGNLAPATEAARAATQREPTNWRTWLVLSRIDAEQGEAAAALRDYRKAKSLNPRSPLFAG